MRSILIFLLFLPLYSTECDAQNDQEAIKILDKFADNALKAPSVSMKFKLITLIRLIMTKIHWQDQSFSIRINTNLIFPIISSGSTVKHHGVICLQKKR